MKNVEDLYPLSPMQQGMLFHLLERPQDQLYFEQFTCQLNGPLDREQFRKAWQQVVDRHPALRTVFLWEGVEEPLQAVKRKVALPFHEEDWRKVPAPQRPEKLRQYLLEDRVRGFELTRAPLLRLALFQQEEMSFEFVFSASHLLLDGWSGTRVLEEGFQIYEQLCRGSQPDLPIPRPYRDSIAWLRQQDPERAREFWAENLEGVSDPPAIPLSRGRNRGPRDSTPTSSDARDASSRDHHVLGTTLGTETATRLEDLARSLRLTPNTLFLGTFAVLWSRWTGQRDFVLGAVVSGRPPELEGVEDMVGLFINTLPLRVRVNPEEPWSLFLERLQAEFLAARQFEWTPISKVQEFASLPPRTALWNAIVGFENYSAGPRLPEQSSLKMQSPRFFDRTNYPWSLVIEPGDPTHLQVTCDSKLLTRDQAETILHSYEQLLGVVDASHRVEQSLLVEPTEREELLRLSQASAGSGPSPSVPDCFEREVARAPDATAIVAEDHDISYGELNRRANQLAHALLERGVTHESLVVICVRNVPERIVTMLAVLKAGGTYVPLDPSDPPARLEQLAKSCGSLVQVTDLPALFSASGRLHLKDLRSDIERRPSDNLARRIDAEQLALVIHTSGSTGQPKGVLLPHRGIVSLVRDQERLSIEATDRVGAASNPAFDASTFEVWTALLHGVPLVVLPRETVLAPERLEQALREQQVTVLLLTTALVHSLAEVHPTALHSLRHLIFGGETVDPDKIRRILDHGFPGLLTHAYGPAENTTLSSLQRVDTVPSGAESIPIGTPMRGREAWVVSHDLQLVPRGVTGELCVAGDGLARGYLGDPRETARRFVPHPFAKTPGTRIYRTGDQANWDLEREALVFRGRRDHQVKIRGFRIELGEVESALRSHPAVRDALVIMNKVPERHLVAYVAGKETSDVHEHLKTTLPKHMVPSAVVWMECLPVHRRGKIDRAALPSPPASRGGSSVLSPWEDVIAAAWREVLPVSSIDPDTDFFESGGHSLTVLQLVSRLREQLRRDLPIRLLFEHSTLRDFARALEDRPNATTKSEPITSLPRDQDLPLSFAQERLWFLEHFEPQTSQSHIAGAVRFHGPLIAEELARCLGELSKRHELLRTRFPTRSGRAFQVIEPCAALDCPIIDATEFTGPERETYVQEQGRQLAQLPFDLDVAPLWRTRLLRFGDDDAVLLLVMHHLIADGWSLSILFRDLTEIYANRSASAATALPALAVQPADVAAWQRDQLSGQALVSRFPFWTEKLSGPLPLLELPADRPRPAVQSTRGSLHRFHVDRDLVERLQTLARSEHATLFMALLSVFQVWLHRITGEEDLLIGTPVAGRARPELENLVGLFVNTVVLRSRVSKHQSLQQVIQQCRETVVEALLAPEVPFEKLVDELATKRDPSHTPLFQVMFAFQNVPPLPESLGNVSLETMELDTGTANFDLTLSMRETLEGLEGTFEYNTDLFEPTTVNRFCEQFFEILEAFTHQPQRPVSSLSLLTENQRRVILDEWSSASPVARSKHDVVDRFLEQVRRTPNHPALTLEDRTLDYAAVERCSAQIATMLVERGVTAEQVVAIALPRSLELIVALLGVLRAGAAFLPLDLRDPPARRELLLRDAKAQLLITDAHSTEGTAGVPVMGVSLDDPLSKGNADRESLPLPHPDQAAYVIYTSGSTGTPKGVVISRGSLANHAAACATRFALSPSDRVLQFATITFDAALEEIFPTLIGGSQLVLQREPLTDPADLDRCLTEQGVTVFNLPTAFFEEWIRALAAEQRRVEPTLRLLIIGGERPSAEAPALWDRVGRSETLLMNTYGPTEATITTAWADVSEESSTWPIGGPVPGNQLFVLDESLEPVPIGTPGELFLGGAQITRGYLHRPDLSAAALVPHPFSQTPGERLYRTGDRVRWNSQGLLESLGRQDDQVKIRGFRIELGELESTLHRVEGVRQAVVLAADLGTGVRTLLAFVVINDASRTVDHLHQELARVLPPHFRPTRITRVEQIPRTKHGKIDREALLAKVDSQSGLPRHSEPLPEAEERIRAIWEEVLGRSNIERHDNFFEVGGDSILSIRVVARCREQGLSFTPKQMFQHPTIAEIARVAQRTTSAAADAAPLVGEVPLGPIQEWFFEQDFPTPHHWNQSVVLESKRPVETATLQRIMQILQTHHDALRLRFHHDGNRWRARMVDPSDLPETIFPEQERSLDAKQKGVEPSAEERLQRAMSRAQTTLNFSEGPMIRVVPVNRGEQGMLLGFIAHHLVIDGVSWRILLDDFQRALTNIERDAEPKLPPRTTSYCDWSQSLGRSSADFDRPYWLEQTSRPWTALPKDSAAVRDGPMAELSRNLEPALTAALVGETCARLHCEMEELLVSALVEALAAWTGSRCHFLELEHHGRVSKESSADLTRTVGWFTSAYPVHFDLREAVASDQVVRTVKETLRRVPDHGIGYGVSRYLRRDPQLISSPEPEVTFNYLGRLDEVFESGSHFRLASVESGPDRDPDQATGRLLELSAWQDEERLHCSWHFCSSHIPRSLVEELARSFEGFLTTVSERRGLGATALSTTDFPHAQVSQKDLNRLLGKIQKGRASR